VLCNGRLGIDANFHVAQPISPLFACKRIQVTRLIYSSPFCETKKTTDYTDSTDRSRTVPKIRAIRVIRGLNAGVYGVVTTVDGLVNNSG
jgi:hypothetical protein